MLMIRYYKTVNGRIRPQEELENGCWINVVNPDERGDQRAAHPLLAGTGFPPRRIG